MAIPDVDMSSTFLPVPGVGASGILALTANSGFS